MRPGESSSPHEQAILGLQIPNLGSDPRPKPGPGPQAAFQKHATAANLNNLPINEAQKNDRDNEVSLTCDINTSVLSSEMNYVNIQKELSWTFKLSETSVGFSVHGAGDVVPLVLDLKVLVESTLLVLL